MHFEWMEDPQMRAVKWWQIVGYFVGAAIVALWIALPPPG